MIARIVTIILSIPTAYLTVFVLNQPLLTGICWFAFGLSSMWLGQTLENEKSRCNGTDRYK